MLFEVARKALKNRYAHENGKRERNNGACSKKCFVRVDLGARRHGDEQGPRWLRRRGGGGGDGGGGGGGSHAGSSNERGRKHQSPSFGDASEMSHQSGGSGHHHHHHHDHHNEESLRKLHLSLKLPCSTVARI